MLDLINELDRVVFDDFVWTPYMSPAWRDIELGWVTEEGEIDTWRATVPIVLFMYVRLHHVDHVKRQFGSQQAIPLDPVNLDEFLHAFRSCTPHTPAGPPRNTLIGGVACRRQFLSADRLLQDPRGVQLPDDVPPAATQARDLIILPRDAPARGRRAQMQRPDIRRKGEGASTSRLSHDQPGGEDVDKEA
ncbi:hypothetical protein PIB30_068642 [Stylosanthes scabra]|uniref:Uncharacterized protein n=1 Tax=Stylosanthes scabra TaxID=79078 RepID=A0ABU6VNW8_9FABA|nr:hypothetical protein [Stylosanthes scabra]